MSAARNLRSLGFDQSPENHLAGGVELTRPCSKLSRSVLENTLHGGSASCAQFEEASKPEAYILENNGALIIQCCFCGNHMTMTTLPAPPSPPHSASGGGEATSVERRDAAVQVNLLPPTELALRDVMPGRNPAGRASSGPVVAGHTSPPNATAACATTDPGVPPLSRNTPAWLAQWCPTFLDESVTKRPQGERLLPAAPVRPTSPIFISSSSSSASTSPSLSPCPDDSWPNTNCTATSSALLPATCPPAPHTTTPQPENTPPQPWTTTTSPAPPTLERISLGLQPATSSSSFLHTSPPKLRISLDMEEVDMAPFSLQLEEDDDEEEVVVEVEEMEVKEKEKEKEKESEELQSHGNGAAAGVMTGLPFECSVSHKNMKCKRNLVNHLQVHTREKPFRCELCRAVYQRVGSFNRHMLKKHQSELLKSINICDHWSSLRTAITAAPFAAAADLGNSVRLKVTREPVTDSDQASESLIDSKLASKCLSDSKQANKSLTDSKQANNAAADSKQVGHNSIDVDISASLDRGTCVANIAKASVGSEDACNAPADSTNAGYEIIGINSTAAVGETTVANVAYDSSVGFKDATDAPAHSKQTKYNIDNSTASVGEANVANITNNVGHDPSSVPTDLALSMDFNVEHVNETMEPNDVTEVKAVTEVNAITEEVNDVREEVNDVIVFNDVIEEVDGITEEVDDVMEVNAIASNTITVCPKKSFFCLDCSESFCTVGDLLEHKGNKHPYRNQQESEGNTRRQLEPFIPLLRFKSEKGLLALIPAKGQTMQQSLRLERGQARKGSSPSLPEIEVSKQAVTEVKAATDVNAVTEEVNGVREEVNDVIVFNDVTEEVHDVMEVNAMASMAIPARGQTMQPSLSLERGQRRKGSSTSLPEIEVSKQVVQCEIGPSQSDADHVADDKMPSIHLRRHRKIPERAEHYWTHVRKKAKASLSPDQHQVTTPQNSIDQQHIQKLEMESPTRWTDNPARRTDTNQVPAIPSFIKPCSVRLVHLRLHTAEAHCILGLQGTGS